MCMVEGCALICLANVAGFLSKPSPCSRVLSLVLRLFPESTIAVPLMLLFVGNVLNNKAQREPQVKSSIVLGIGKKVSAVLPSLAND